MDATDDVTDLLAINIVIAPLLPLLSEENLALFYSAQLPLLRLKDSLDALIESRDISLYGRVCMRFGKEVLESLSAFGTNDNTHIIK